MSTVELLLIYLLGSLFSIILSIEYWGAPATVKFDKVLAWFLITVLSWALVLYLLVAISERDKQ